LRIEFGYLLFESIYAILKTEREMTALKIQESAEMYLETILVLGQKNPTVRAVDVAAELNYKKSSVSVAMKNLRENDCIRVDEDGSITLTDKGRQIAETMLERHTLLSDWLITLGVDPAVAVDDACRMEHIISAESFEAIKKHVRG
jgi:Mn-dependent DtxR family transcriptional regulator